MNDPCLALIGIVLSITMLRGKPYIIYITVGHRL